MKTVAALFAFFLGIAIFSIRIIHVFPAAPAKKTITKVIATPTPLTVQSASSTTTLFVPYWTLTNQQLPDRYNQIAYFGITANTQGIDTAEDGYKDLAAFVRITPPQAKTLLVVRLITPDVNEQLLTDTALQQKIIIQSMSVAKQYRFQGVVLDFEYSALAFDTVVHQVTSLTKNFSSQVHSAQLSYYQTLYGDTFYRLRPFDVSAIGNVSDGIFVMAYDFHKANGNPGPNFPLHALPDEDYSFTQMVSDFTSKVPAEKLTILFGLFGYDWTMNNKNESLGQADVLTTLEAQKKFSASCTLKNCRVIQDSTSTEQHAHYIGDDGRTHEVWFEDMTSIAKKQAFLKTKGISSTGFWAWSYF